MFTGIVEEIGEVTKIKKNKKNLQLFIKAQIVSDVKVDQSISHNGVCLTVENILDESYKVTAIEETLLKSNIGSLKVGSPINIERCLKVGGRIDGHMVQGHVDTTGKCISIKNRKGSWIFSFSFPKKYSSLLIDKGSICVNGVSLTIMKLKKKSFSVAIIPYTFEHTNFKDIQIGNLVNLEFDVLGKYILRQFEI